MEPDFVTRLHTESLTPYNDPGLSEVLNNYKFPPPQPQRPQQPVQFAGSSQNDVFLGAMLGQIQASLNNKPQNYDGFNLSINADVLKWIVALLVLIVVIWLVFTLAKRETSPLKRRLHKLEKRYKRLKRLKKKKKNPSLPDESYADADDIEDFDDFDEDY